MSEAAEAAPVAEAPAGEAPPQDMPQTPEPQAEPQTEAQKEAAAEEERLWKQSEMNKVIDKVRRNARYLGRREGMAEAYEKLMAERSAPPKPDRVADATQVLDKPIRNQYASDEEYIAAVAAHTVRTEIHGQQSKVAEQTEREQQARLLEGFQSRVQSARDSLPDYDEVVGLSDAPMSKPMAEAILDSDVGPQLTYHLAKNPQEAARIAALSPVKAIREIAAIEAKLKAPAIAPAAKATSAPPPPTHVSGRGTTAAKDPSRMSMEEFDAWRRTRGW